MYNTSSRIFMFIFYEAKWKLSYLVVFRLNLNGMQKYIKMYKNICNMPAVRVWSSKYRDTIIQYSIVKLNIELISLLNNQWILSAIIVTLLSSACPFEGQYLLPSFVNIPFLERSLSTGSESFPLLQMWNTIFCHFYFYILLKKGSKSRTTRFKSTFYVYYPILLLLVSPRISNMLAM